VRIRQVERILKDGEPETSTCEGNGILLSILIPTLPKRRAMLGRMLGCLRTERDLPAEIVVFEDNKQWSVGEKRNALVRAAAGQFTVFVDDDDRVSEDYLDTILRILCQCGGKIDCIGIAGIMSSPGWTTGKKFVHSLAIRGWYERAGVFYRCPNHWNPVRRDIARMVSFPNVNCGEDIDWSLRLLPRLRNSVDIGWPIYFYEFSPTNTETQKR